MSKIRVNVDYPIYDGQSLTFNAPCDCTSVDGLRVYYPGGNKTFSLCDAHNKDISGIGNVFSAGALIKVVLDVANERAYLQNADYNTYIDGLIRKYGQVKYGTYEGTGDVVASLDLGFEPGVLIVGNNLDYNYLTDQSKQHPANHFLWISGQSSILTKVIHDSARINNQSADSHIRLAFTATGNTVSWIGYSHAVGSSNETETAYFNNAGETYYYLAIGKNDVLGSDIEPGISNGAVGEVVATTAVLYTPQNLTEAQKAQARKNIGITDTKVDPTANVPDYWQGELETKADAIQAAMEKAGRNKSAFLWYTDAHWVNGNSKVSPKLLNYLYMNTPMNKVNFGGDIIGDTLLATREKMKYLYEWRKAIKDLPNHHSVLGNHDMFNLDTVDYEDDNYRYAFLIAPEESSDMVMGDGNYYYIDNNCEKTRYLYICYPNTVQSDLMAQTTFIAEALNSTPEGWHIVAIAHRWWQYSSSSTPTSGALGAFEADILEVFDAYNARTTRSGSNHFYAQDFTNAKGKVEFCIGGHIHVDYDFESAGGIPVIITTADTNQNRVLDSTVDSGTVGTTTEAAVFGIIADYNDADNTKITVVGVGRGTSRVVRKSTVKPISISNITYSGDTTVGAIIDKSKFSFTVNYSNGTTDTITGATSVSPVTIGVVGNNSVTISYTESGTTVSGTATIVGTAAPVANLLNLDRTYVAGAGGEYLYNNLDENKAYTNVVYSTAQFYETPSVVSNITEDSVTVKEAGVGGVYLAYAIYLPNIRTDAYRLKFDYSGTGKCRTAYRYGIDGAFSGNKNLFTDDTAGASGSADVVIPANAEGYTWLIIMFGSNTSGTKTYTNVSLTPA